jgi:hypothetical protein
MSSSPARHRDSVPSPRHCRRLSRGFRPCLEPLEDRALPSTIAYQVPAGTVGQQAFGGPLGMDFDVTQGIVVTRLGVFDSGSDGLALPLTARLYNRDTQTEVADLAFSAGQTGTLVGGSRFLPLPAPVVLPPGFHGSIVAEGYGAAEPDGNAMAQPISWTTNDGGGLIQFVGTGRYGMTPGAFPANPDSGPANRYAAGTFDFMPLGQIATGLPSATAGTSYTLNLNLPGATAITSWTVSWGDGSSSVLPGNPTQAAHVYAAGGNFSIAVTASTAQGTLGTSYHDVVLEDAPAAYWRLDETSLVPPTAHDEVGGHDAAYQNFSAADLGQPGALSNDPSTSVHFNGVNEYVSLPDVFHFPTGGTTTQYAVSFGAWFKTATSGVILGQADPSGVPGGAAPQTGWVPAVYVGTDGKVHAALFWHGFGPTLSSPGTYTDNKWHQVVAVYGNGVETLYLDGNAVASQAVLEVGYAPAYSYTLGTGYTANWPSAFGGWSFFNGQLDEVAVHGGALTAQEVAAQYLAGTTARLPVVVQNATPTVSLQGPTDGVRGQPRSFTFSATSPSATEQAGGFTYTINWGDGSPVQTVGRTPGNGAGVTLSHVFTESGTYTVTVTATDQDGHASAPASQGITITPWAIQLQPDPVHPGQTMRVLVVGGSTGSDDIVVTRAAQGIQVDIQEKTFHNHLDQVFSGPIDRIVVYGQDGNDFIAVAPDVRQTAELYGGGGDDVLIGGGGNNLLVGGDGNDVLIGGRGRNVLIGGQGEDVLIGGGRSDLLIGGSTAFDANEAALRAILAEWTSAASYPTRVGHLLGTLPGGLNGGYDLNASTVYDDGSADLLWGGGGRDWFVAGKKGQVLDPRHGEVVTLAPSPPPPPPSPPPPPPPPPPLLGPT